MRGMCHHALLRRSVGALMSTPFRIFGGSVRSALVHAATQHDIRNARGKRYNHYALAQYFARIDEVCDDIAKGANPREALLAAFSDRLLDCFLKAIGEPKFTLEEKRAPRSVTYRPTTKEG